MVERGKKQPSWAQKFACAFRGVALGVRGERSFPVHAVFAAGVVAAAAFFRVALWEWAVLCLCITVVLTAEMLNSALERMARAVDDQYNEQLGAALDIGSAAVLTAAIGASLIGALIFVPHIVSLITTG